MSQPIKRNFTGFVLPVGNGAVGKTSLARVLDKLGGGNTHYANIIHSLSKTKNLEFEFIPVHLNIRDRQFRVLMQILIPPGQKNTGGDHFSRSYEQVIDIYRFHIRRLDVVLFTYDLTSRKSFLDLNYWIHAVKDLWSNATHFLLLGTHLDRMDQREISTDEIDSGLAYIKRQITNSWPAWQGRCHNIEVSNLTGENMIELKRQLALCIIRARCINSAN